VALVPNLGDASATQCAKTLTQYDSTHMHTRTRCHSDGVASLAGQNYVEDSLLCMRQRN
jgi:hypothetical protein